MDSFGPLNRVRLSEFEFKQTLGKGSFSKIKLAKSNITNKLHAVKIMKKAELIRLKQVDHVLFETSILNSVRHPFIVEMTGFTQDDKYVYLVLEYVPGGELFSYLKQVTRLDVKQAVFYAAQVTMVFEFLHNKHIIYRDLKPENLIFCEDGYLKLIDFGFVKLTQRRTYTLCGTPEYLAPEMLLNKGHGKAVDWWTLGIFLYELLVGIAPFMDDDPMMIYQKILKGKFKFPKNFDKNAKSLIKHLLVSDLSKRYGNLKNGANDIKNHRLFKEINWDMLLTKQIPAPYKPIIKPVESMANSKVYPDSEDETVSIRKNDDPFIDW